jgi:hypothetical protein
MAKNPKGKGPGRYRSAAGLLQASPLFISESAEEFDCIRDALDQEINPSGIIENMFMADVACLCWEILRLRRCKAAVVNAAFPAAVESVVEQLLRDPEQYGFEIEESAAAIAMQWFTDQTVKDRILELLKAYQLDESVFEAEAIRNSTSELEQLEKLQASAEARRNRALLCIAEYRADWSQVLRESSDRIIDGKVIALEDASRKKPPAACCG